MTSLTEDVRRSADAVHPHRTHHHDQPRPHKVCGSLQWRHGAHEDHPGLHAQPVHGSGQVQESGQLPIQIQEHLQWINWNLIWAGSKNSPVCLILTNLVYNTVLQKKPSWLPAATLFTSWFASDCDHTFCHMICKRNSCKLACWRFFWCSVFDEWKVIVFFLYFFRPMLTASTQTCNGRQFNSIEDAVCQLVYVERAEVIKSEDVRLWSIS